MSHVGDETLFTEYTEGMGRILCLEDAEDMNLIIGNALEGLPVVFARSVEEARNYAGNEDFSLFLVDIHLPDGTGFDFIEGLSPQQKAKPILFLTGKQDFASKLAAFTLGADDFIVKPFDRRDLRLRVESKLRRQANSVDERRQFTIGNLLCSPEEQSISKQGDFSKIELTSIEFRLFLMLSHEQARIFSREQILNRVWTDDITVSDRTVDVHISNLRRKLSGSRVHIETVIGSGYRLLVRDTDSAKGLLNLD
jgi:DNA-binding response OmpR family regulator